MSKVSLRTQASRLMQSNHGTSANEIGSKAGLTEEDLFSRTLMCVAYRIYLMGVQDGMKEDEENE